MGILEHQRSAPFINSKDAHGIKAQKKKIHQIFMRKPFRSKMRMKKTRTAQAARAGSGMRKSRDEYGRGIPYDNHAHPSLPVYGEPYLTGNQPGQRRKLSRLFRAVPALRRIAALPQPDECLQLAALQAGGIAFNPGSYCTPPAIQVAIMSS